MKTPIYLAYAQEGGLSRLQDVDEDELLKTIQRLPNSVDLIQYPLGF